jgi:phage terminase small subunit
MELEPPRQLTLAARRHWDRHAERIHDDGRWKLVDLDVLALYAETLALYEQLRDDIAEQGTTVPARAAAERVRHPSLMGLAQCRSDLLRMAKAVPLTDPQPDQLGLDVDRLLAEYA